MHLSKTAACLLLSCSLLVAQSRPATDAARSVRLEFDFETAIREGFVPPGSSMADLLARASTVVTARLASLQIEGAKVTSEPPRAVLVVLPQLSPKEQERARRLLALPGRLEFWMVADREPEAVALSRTELQVWLTEPGQRELVLADPRVLGTFRAKRAPTIRWALHKIAPQPGKGKWDHTYSRMSVVAPCVLPLFTAAEFDAAPPSDSARLFELVALDGDDAIESGQDLDADQIRAERTADGQVVLRLAFRNEKIAEHAAITRGAVGHCQAIVQDGVILSAPRFESAIVNGKSQIHGCLELEETELLALALRAGALPLAPLVKIGPLAK